MGGKQSKPPSARRKKTEYPVKAGECPVVQTKFGPVRGKISYTLQGSQPVYNYLGVPYAAPPTGVRRFCPPAPPTTWTKVKATTTPGLPCPQAMEETTKGFYPVPVPEHRVSEDCLHLNIYTKSVGGEALKPVMVWIHGGSFNKGMSQFYDGTAYAMYGDVVVVTVGYRLGALGFLTLEDNMCPGNFGFLDQVAALCWVQENIRNFGGDPCNVTLFGESAGAVSVQFMLLSPLAKGLFHRAISQSGAATVRTATTLRGTMSGRDKALTLAKHLGCTTTDTRSVLAFLRQTPADKLIEVQARLAAKGIAFVLQVDNHFMLRDPLELYSAGHVQRVPHIIGFNNCEGYYFCKRQCPHFTEKSITEDQCLHFIHRFLSFVFPKHEDRVLDIVRKEYFPEKEKDKRRTDLEYLRIVTAEALGDLFLTAATYQSAEMHCGCAATYLYVYAHKPAYSRFPMRVEGATHEEELLLSWGDPWMDRPVNRVISYTTEEKQLSLKIIKYWTNFAKTGNPNSTDLVAWPQFDLGMAQYLRIDTNMRTGDNYNAHRMRLWTQIVPDMLSDLDI